MREPISRDVPSATLDDHRTWVDRLVAMARTTVTIGMAVLVLMLSATVLSVVFATRGAMAGNGHIIEVLHFVGAEARLHRARIPPAFPVDRHEGRGRRRRRRDASSSSSSPSGRRATWRRRRPTRRPRCSAISPIGVGGYAGVALIVLVIAALTAATSHVTVVDLSERHRAAPTGRRMKACLPRSLRVVSSTVCQCARNARLCLLQWPQFRR